MTAAMASKTEQDVHTIPSFDIDAHRRGALPRRHHRRCKGAFSREWVEQLREDMMTAFWEALQRPGGAVGRGPRRWYVEIHPQAVARLRRPRRRTRGSRGLRGGARARLRDRRDRLRHPRSRARSTSPGTATSRRPPETYEERRLTSLAFNLTGVDVTQDMGPFEIAPGTQWDDGREWRPRDVPAEGRLAALRGAGVRKFPQMGDISCRSALTIHRGTANRSPIAAAGARARRRRARARATPRCTT